MKILFLGEPDSPNTISWVEGLRDGGCEVLLASVRTDGSDGNIPIGNVKYPPRIRILTGAKHLKKIIKREKPDILIAYRITSYGYLAAKTNFHPLVLAAQNEQIVYLPTPSFFRYKFIERCARFAISKSDLIHSWGENITEGLLKFGADKNKILTLHRGIDTDTFSLQNKSNDVDNNDQSHKWDSKAPVFLSTRSLAPEYLIKDLIIAFKEVVNSIPNAKLEIAGTGSEESDLKEEIKKLKLENNILFHGRLNKKELIHLIYNSDIYISIIQTEGISSSLIEGIAAKLLPIVADMAASRTLINDNINGLLINDISPKSLSDSMLKAIEYYIEMESETIKNSTKIIDQFSREKNQKIFIENYKRLLKF